MSKRLAVFIAVVIFATPTFAFAESYSFPSGFSSVQGQNNWRYQYGSGGTFTNMTWDAANSRWKGNEEYALIGNWGTHPGSAVDSVLTWTAPHGGEMRITGTVSDANPSCGDGVAPSVLLNTSTLWNSTVNNGDTSGVSFNLTTHVATGDTVRFVTNKRGDHVCDTTSWDLTVAYAAPLPVSANDGHVKIEAVGNVETVMHHPTDACGVDDVPDTAQHAFRNAAGQVVLTGNATSNYRSIGATLDSVKRDCSPTYVSANDSAFNNFKYHEWLFSPYTLDGTHVYALTHNEWYPSLGGFCPANTGVVGAVTLLTSNNGGATYTHPTNYKVGVPGVTWNALFPCNSAYGDWNVSNIIAKDGYYYALFNREADPNGVASAGTCAMRTTQLADATSWQVWTDAGWQPLSTTPKCTGLPGLQSWVWTVVESVVYSTYLNKYVALAIDNLTHVMYSTSQDLLHWSTPQQILGLPVSEVTLYYGSLIDPTDTSRNFENIGQEPYLYFSNYGIAGGDIIRQKIHFTNLDASQTYALPADFSSAQGTKQWFYQYGATAPYTPMTWDASTNRWKGDETYILVGAGWMHPGSNSDAVLKWVAPQSGVISITGTVADANPSCGDGVEASVLRNGDTVWQRTINNGDTTGFAPTLSVAATSGDAIYFVVNRLGEYSCDATNWNPTIHVSAPSLPGPYVFSSGYGSTQGGGGWRYQYKNTGGYADMSWSPAPWDSSAHLWGGNETYLLIGNGWLHPGVNADVALQWVAPKDGTVRVTGTASDSSSSCGDGVIVSILRNTTSLWQQTINNGDSVGKSHALYVAVIAGDKLYFMVNKNGDNGCDTTGWDPTITYQSIVAQARPIDPTAMMAAVVMAPFNFVADMFSNLFVLLGIAK